SNDTDRDPDKNARLQLRRGGNSRNEVGCYQEYATASPKDAFRATTPNAMIGDRSLDSGCDVVDAGRYRGGDGTGRTDGSGGALTTRPLYRCVSCVRRWTVNDQVTPPVDRPAGRSVASAGNPRRRRRQHWAMCGG